MQIHVGVLHFLRGQDPASAAQGGPAQGMDQDQAVSWRGKTLSTVGLTHREVNKKEDLSLLLNIFVAGYVKL